MEKFETEVAVDITMTASDLAHLFWSMDQYEIREFFNALAKEANFDDFSSQMYAVTDGTRSAVVLSKEAKNLMREIGDAAGQGDQHV